MLRNQQGFFADTASEPLKEQKEKPKADCSKRSTLNPLCNCFPALLLSDRKWGDPVARARKTINIDRNTMNTNPTTACRRMLDKCKWDWQTDRDIITGQQGT